MTSTLQDTSLKEQLRLALKGASKRGEFTLASGRKSDFYLDARLVTLTPQGLRLAGTLLWKLALQLGVTAIGGPATASVPIFSAAAALAHADSANWKLFYVRPEAKGHGMMKLIEGPPLGADDKVLMVDDVATTGGSVLKAVAEIRRSGAKVEHAFVLVDRLEGARGALREAGIELHAAFTREDILQ